ncbi:MAG: putative transcriptional regulator EpsA, LuxR family [Ramlibacter sp.]|nr:putative transcriptional regulator EpsA, LuxR family [Ramlibacter sp.]
MFQVSPMNAVSSLPPTDAAQYLKIASQGSGLCTHAELWRWLQGDVQSWLAHDVMLIGWGDFGAGQLRFDVVSSLPGVRSRNCAPALMSALIAYFRDCWVAAQQAPCELDIGPCRTLLDDCARGWSNHSIANLKTALVHGTGDRSIHGERIFVALSERPSAGNGAATALKLLVPFIDMALRRMPPAPPRQVPCERRQTETLVMKLGALSERERQIMVWVAMGKTNPEIGSILCISEFTVKNHMKSIFNKLVVTNRAQAVAKLTRMAANA